MFSYNTNHSAVHSPMYKASQVTQQKPIHSTMVSLLQGRIRCPSVIKHKVNSQAYISCHLFHPTARLTLILSMRSMPTCLYNSLLLPSLSSPYQQDRANSKLYDTLRSQARPKPQLALFATSSLAHFILQCCYSFI